MDFRKVLNFLNVPKRIVEFLLGEDHSVAHRMTAGFAVMAVGVLVAKAGADVHVYFVHYLADGFGYAVHGLGAAPFIEWLLAKPKEAEDAIHSAVDHARAVFADTVPAGLDDIRLLDV